MGRPQKNPSGYEAEYKAWHSMKSRVSDRTRANAHRYIGRGIRVCDEWWKSFPAFLTYMGRKPSPKHTLERVDNNKGYEPGNVVWALPQQNHRNKSSNRKITLLGETLLLCEWAERLGISKQVLRYRLSAKWSEEDIVNKGLRPWPGKHGRR